MELRNIGIIGVGNIGGELEREVISLGWNVELSIGSKGDYLHHKRLIKSLDGIFLAIPTLDEGEVARDYIQSTLDLEIPIVTCEKGALSNYYSEFKKDIDNGRIGCSASVGGGSGILSYLREMIGPGVNEVHCVLNGTLNYIFDSVSKRMSIEEAVKSAVDKGYCEPGGTSVLDVINQEVLGDIPMKTAILINYCNFSNDVIEARNILTRSVSRSSLDKLLRESSKIRHIVSFRRDWKNENVVSGFEYRFEDWYVSAGFKDVESDDSYKNLLLEGVDNGLVICKFNGENYYLSGQGAGAKKTVGVMIKDADKVFLKKK